MNMFAMVLGLLAAQTPPPDPQGAFRKGLELARTEQREQGAREFEFVRSNGTGELRRAAIYNLGTLSLQEAESWRAKLPEVQKNAGAGALPLPPVQGDAKEPDALTEARKHYMEARKATVERLRIDWRDADTRANAELITKRLAELDRIEKERAQKQQEQQKQDQQKQDEQKEDQKQDQQKQDQQDPKDKPDQPKPDEQKPEDQKPEDQKQDEQKPEEKQPDKPKDQPKPGQTEQALSKEEMVQLLDRLQKIEEQAEKLKAQMRESRRTAVKKDW